MFFFKQSSDGHVSLVTVQLVHHTDSSQEREKEALEKATPDFTKTDRKTPWTHGFDSLWSFLNKKISLEILV